ncbi:MAG: dTDP-4-dehydrorhamnose 3,5-epimerase family protein [Vulcanimicrobiaceae bacterium]
MIRSETELEGVFLLRRSGSRDERGTFFRIFDADEFVAMGLCSLYKQFAVSTNHAEGTLRGLHFQTEPFAETKIVRCVRGTIFDVVVDYREASPTRGKYVAFELAADDGRFVYIPPGCAHGFFTLEDNSHIEYMISESYYPELGRGFRWDSSALAIAWPGVPKVISDRDRTWPEFV